jgi:hypothetical protein
MVDKQVSGLLPLGSLSATLDLSSHVEGHCIRTVAGKFLIRCQLDIFSGVELHPDPSL